MKTKKTALVIGALGGLAQATIQELVDQSWYVYAADVQEEILKSYALHENVRPLVLDITQKECIKSAFEEISNEIDGLDAVIHMAGVLQIGSLVEIPVEELEKTLQINLLGIYQVNRQFLPLLLSSKGRIINLSSEIGLQSAAPFNGFYSISKHALEAYSDALRRELAFLGIKVIKIQPGPFKTNMTKGAEKKFKDAVEQSVYFKKNLAKGIPYLPKVYKNAKQPQLVARTILKALNSKRPKTAYPVNIDKTRAFLDMLPSKWADAIIKKALS